MAQMEATAESIQAPNFTSGATTEVGETLQPIPTVGTPPFTLEAQKAVEGGEAVHIRGAKLVDPSTVSKGERFAPIESLKGDGWENL
jgi:hypothetical protein